MTELGKTCSHGVAWGDHCPECELISARQIVDHWGEMVDEARRVIDAVNRPAPSKPPRYKVEKQSGSQYAYVVDTETGLSIKRYNIFKGDGWGHADRHAAKLNELDEVKV